MCGTVGHRAAHELTPSKGDGDSTAAFIGTNRARWTFLHGSPRPGALEDAQHRMRRRLTIRRHEQGCVGQLSRQAQNRNLHVQVGGGAANTRGCIAATSILDIARTQL